MNTMRELLNKKKYHFKEMKDMKDLVLNKNAWIITDKQHIRWRKENG